MNRIKILKCHKIIGGYGEGEALVSHEPICFYLTDPKTGVIRERTHELAGESVASKVLVFPSGKASSVVQIDGLFKLVQNSLAPKAMIVKDIETVLFVTAFIAQVPLVDKLEENPFDAIHSGDLVKVDADKGIATVVNKTSTAHVPRFSSPFDRHAQRINTRSKD